MSFHATGGEWLMCGWIRKQHQTIAFDPKRRKTAGVAHWVIQGRAWQPSPTYPATVGALSLARSARKTKTFSCCIVAVCRERKDQFDWGHLQGSHAQMVARRRARLRSIPDRSGNYEIWLINKDASI